MAQPALNIPAPDRRRSQADGLPPARTLILALERLGEAVLLTRADGNLLFATRNGHRLTRRAPALFVACGRVTTCSARDRAALRGALEKAGKAGPGEEAEFALGEPGQRLHVVLRRVDEKGPILWWIRDLEASRLPSEAGLRRVFGLSPAEARLAVGLAAGGVLYDLANAAGVTRNTIRRRLCSVFQKMGARSQAALISRVQRMIGAPTAAIRLESQDLSPSDGRTMLKNRETMFR